MCNGLAYDGIFPSLMRQARRSRCLPITLVPPSSARRRCRNTRSLYIYTHDSVGVGEDGPTHLQPVESDFLPCGSSPVLK